MKKRIAVVALLAAMLWSCDPLARSEMTLVFDDTGERVNVSVVSDENHIKLYHANEREQLAGDVVAGRDEWSIRFDNAHADEQRLVLNRNAQGITRVENQATINTADLQRFFSDSGISVQVTRGEGWAELTFYPGTSNRATRQEQAIVKQKLDAYSHVAANYLNAVRDFYRYLDANDARAAEMFYAVFAGDKDEQPQISEKEQVYVDKLRKAAEALDAADNEDRQLSRLADLVYNPFPAVIDVRVPGAPLAVEGFSGTEQGLLRATTATPLEALGNLEGRWVSPDPMAALMRRAKDRPTREFTDELAAQPRTTAAEVVPSDIANALIDGVRPAARYRVRWVTKRMTTNR